MGEVLLVGPDDDAVAAAGGRVLQRAGRVVVAELPDGASVPGARAPTPEALAALDEGERLFAAGWAAGRAPKERPGDGLPWDAPGFEAP
jgi:hypothetical protein